MPCHCWIFVDPDLFEIDPIHALGCVALFDNSLLNQYSNDNKDFVFLDLHNIIKGDSEWYWQFGQVPFGLSSNNRSFWQWCPSNGFAIMEETSSS